MAVLIKDVDHHFKVMTFNLRFDNPADGFIIYNTHLDHKSERSRQNGIKLIWEVISEKRLESHLPAFLLGDFNANPLSDEVAYLQHKMRNALDLIHHNPAEIGCTY